MLDDDTTRGKVLRTAMRLAAEKGWRRLSLSEIAAEAQVGLADIRDEFGSKTGLLTAFVEEVDKTVLKQAPAADPETPARDRLFEVMMTRLDILKPYKGAIRRLTREGRCAPPGPESAARLLCASVNSHRWMLAAAGIPADGGKGCVRASGLMCIYAQVMPVWLRDDSEDLARTMAALDGALRDGERWIMRLDALCGGIARIACCFVPRRRDRAPEPEAPPPAAEQPGAA